MLKFPGSLQKPWRLTTQLKHLLDVWVGPRRAKRGVRAKPSYFGCVSKTILADLRTSLNQINPYFYLCHIKILILVKIAEEPMLCSFIHKKKKNM